MNNWVIDLNDSFFINKDEYISKLNKAREIVKELRKKYELNDKEKELYDAWLNYLYPAIEENESYVLNVKEMGLRGIVITIDSLRKALAAVVYDEKNKNEMEENLAEIQENSFSEFQIRNNPPEIKQTKKLNEFITILANFETINNDEINKSLNKQGEKDQEHSWRLKSLTMKKLIMYRYLKAYDEWIEEWLTIHWVDNFIEDRDELNIHIKVKSIDKYIYGCIYSYITEDEESEKEREDIFEIRFPKRNMLYDLFRVKHKITR